MTIKTTIIAAGALVAASAAAAPSAQASQVNFSLHLATPHASVHFTPGHRGPVWHRHALSQREIRFLLRRAGYYNVHRLDRRDQIYVARVVSRNGFFYTVRLSAYTGRIIATHRGDRVGHHGHTWGWR